MTSTLDDSLTCDAFLGGRLRIWQPRLGYRAGVDPVLLAASVPAKPGETVLELGCGVGVAALCLWARTSAVVDGLEFQPRYFTLAERNAQENTARFEATLGDLRDMPTSLRARSFDHVMANPPYYDRAQGTAARNVGREAALGEAAPLAAWVDAGVRRLKPRGTLTMIQRAERLPDLISAVDGRLGGLTVLPIAPRRGRSAELIILCAQKSSKSPFRLLQSLTMHSGARHGDAGDHYSKAVTAVLREGASLEVSFGETSQR